MQCRELTDWQDKDINMEYYPNTLPKFLQSSYSLKRSPSVIRTTMTNGTVRQRLSNMVKFLRKLNQSWLRLVYCTYSE